MYRFGGLGASRMRVVENQKDMSMRPETETLGPDYRP